MLGKWRHRMVKQTGREKFWPQLPDLDDRMPLDLVGNYSSHEFERLARGFKSSGMDEKWDIYYREPWLTFHRSWTGIGIYGIRLETTGESAHIAESWVNGAEQECEEEFLEYHRKLLTFLVDVFLLRQPAELPVPRWAEGLEGLQALAYVHMVVGYLPGMTKDEGA